MESRNTQVLVTRAQGGDAEAYDQLFAYAAERVQLFIRLRLGIRLRDKLDSLDVLQETYLEAHRVFDRFEYRGDDAFARWLCRIAENRIRGLADHFGAKKRTPPGKQVKHVSQVIEKARNSGIGPVTAAARAETRSSLEAALEKLEGEEREVLLYRFFQDRTFDEIAALMGRSASAVRRLVGRAMRHLGAAMRP